MLKGLDYYKMYTSSLDEIYADSLKSVDYICDDLEFIYSGGKCIVRSKITKNKAIVSYQNDGKNYIPRNIRTGFLYAMIKYICYNCRYGRDRKEYSKICKMELRTDHILEGILIGYIGYDKFKRFDDTIMDKFYPNPLEWRNK